MRHLLFMLLMAALGFFLNAAPAAAEVMLPGIFGDNMVLQSGVPIPVWGWAAKGETVTVALAGESRSANAGDNGRWKVALPALPAGGPKELAIKGSGGSSLAYKNVLLGEVWLCSGQSNMDMPIGNLNVRDQETKAADYPSTRQFVVERVRADSPQENCKGNWIECSPKTLWDFSAVSYYFGRKLHQQLKTPVGLIVSSMGATSIEPWSSRPSLGSDPDVKGFRINDSRLYNSMIAPLVPYAIRGMLWYQGESNVGNAWQYQALLSAMIRDRRRDFGENLPVGIVQIAPFRYPDHDPRACPEIWEAELATHQSQPNTGLIVTTDLGDVKDIHPQRKQEVGDRLALWAMAKVYGRTDLVYSGPIFRSMKIEGDKIRVEFDGIGGGLASRDENPLSDFTLAGDDEVFHPATANIDGSTIVVSSDTVPRPVAVRFGWRDDAQPNLTNIEKLPAMPFRSDRWRRVTEPISVPHFFSDHMVIERDTEIPIWGWSGPDRNVTVRFDKAEYHAIADAKGQWMVKLPPMPAGTGHGMTIGDHLSMGNVAIGDVWVCAGQSNMEKPIGPHPGQKPCLNWEKEIAAADYPQIRLLEVPPTRADAPAADVDCKWLPCSPQTIVIQRGGGHGYSAAAYFFGRELHKELKIPIGLIAASASGTRCEPWTPAHDPAGNREAALYNGMIAPLIPMAFRGVIWYQGESNMGDGPAYFPKMKHLITGWRKNWGRGDFPFYFVQLPDFACGGGDSLAKLREAQTATLAVPNTGMAVTIDIGSYPDCHCPNKQEVGRRLALWALAKTYGRSDLVYSGPLYKSMQIEGNKIRIRFDHTGSGLTTRDGAKDLTNFEIAGPDQKFVPATADIDGDTVLVSSDQVTHPTASRFAWDEHAVPNLMNKDGLPASTFCTAIDRRAQ